MEYRKERNLLIATDENGNCKGKYDWESATFYGAKGTQIKKMPAAFNNSVYSSIITSHQWIITHLTDGWLERALRRWECMASLGIYCTNHEVLLREEEMPALKKDFVTFLKNNGNEYSDSLYRIYNYSVIVPEYTLLNPHYRQIVNSIIRNTYWNPIEFPIEWGIKALFRLQCEDAGYLLNGISSLVDMLNEYYVQCHNMGQECVITKNFLITIAHTFHLYNNYKLEKMSELIKMHNDIPQLYYENDTFIVRPLCSREEFHAEAEAQNNCVERLYMESVANGRTYVVVVRRKNNPDESYITCEINNRGDIIQYLAKNNQRPSANDARAFEDVLQRHLNSLSWNKG